MTKRAIRSSDFAFNPASSNPPDYPGTQQAGYVNKSIAGGTQGYDGYHLLLTSQILPFVVGGCHTLLHRFVDVQPSSGTDFTFRNGILQTPFPVVIDITGIGFMPAVDIDDDGSSGLRIKMQDSGDSADVSDDFVITLDQPTSRRDSGGTSRSGARGAAQFLKGKYYTFSTSVSGTSDVGINDGAHPTPGGFPMTRQDMLTINDGTANNTRAGMPAQSILRSVGKFELVDSDSPNAGLNNSSNNVTLVLDNIGSPAEFAVVDVFGTVKVSV